METKNEISAQILALQSKSLKELQAKYAELFTEEISSNNKVNLWRKIAYKLQEREHGGLSKEALARIDGLIKEIDPINNKSLRPEKNIRKSGTPRDRRLPIPGTILTKQYKNQLFEIKVLENGFEYNGKQYRSLTSISEEITGSHWSGFNFFNLE